MYWFQNAPVSDLGHNIFLRVWYPVFVSVQPGRPRDGQSSRCHEHQHANENHLRLDINPAIGETPPETTVGVAVRRHGRYDESREGYDRPEKGEFNQPENGNHRYWFFNISSAGFCTYIKKDTISYKTLEETEEKLGNTLSIFCASAYKDVK